MTMPVKRLAAILKQPTFLYGIHNAIAENHMNEEFQAKLMDLGDAIHKHDDETMQNELLGIYDVIQGAVRMTSQLAREISSTSDKVDDGSIEHDWLTIMVTYQDHLQRVMYLLSELAQLWVSEKGLIGPSSQAVDWMNDCLARKGRAGLEECLTSLHLMTTGENRDIKTKPILDVYVKIAAQDDERGQSVRWCAQAFSSCLLALHAAGAVALMVAHNMAGNLEKLQAVRDAFSERCGVQKRKMDAAIRKSSAKFSKSVLQKEPLGDVPPFNCVTPALTWTPVTGARLVIHDPNLLSIQLTAMSCDHNNTAHGPPDVTETFLLDNEIINPDRTDDSYQARRITVNRVDDRWLRVPDPVHECICHVQLYATNVAFKLRAAIGNRCSAETCWLEHDEEHGAGKNPPVITPCLDKDWFYVDVGEVLPRFPGWVTGVRLYRKTVGADETESALALELETSFL